MKTTTIAAIDFGTSKIVTLVAEHSSTVRLDVVGSGLASYDGFLHDGWNNPGNLNDRILASIQDAEKQLKESKHVKGSKQLHNINVGVPAAFSRVYATQAHIQLKGADPQVTEESIREIFAVAQQNLAPTMGYIIHSAPAWFSLDNGRKMIQPGNHKGRELSALISYVVADRNFVDDISARLGNLGYRVDGFYSSAAGEAKCFLPEEDRDRTCVLIDMGYLNTTVMVAEGDAIIYMDTIELGGGNIAANLAMELGIPLSEAEEKIKRQYIFGIDSENRPYELPGSDGNKPRSFSRIEVTDIICPVVDEIAAQILNRLDDSGITLHSGSKVYLTGGGLCFNAGGKDYLSARLNRTVREVQKQNTSSAGHNYSSALGLMDLIVETVTTSQQKRANSNALTRFFRNLFEMN